MSDFLIEIARRTYNYGKTSLEEMDELVKKGTLTVDQVKEFTFNRARRDFYLLKTLDRSGLDSLVAAGRLTAAQRTDILNYMPRTQALVKERTKESYR